MSVLLWASGRGPAFQDRLSRALAMAEALGTRGLDTRVALPVEEAALGWLESAGVRNPVLLPERDSDLRAVLAARGSAGAVVADVERPLSRADVRALSRGNPLIVVEGCGPGLAEADVVVTLEPDARRSRALAGPAYVPLRRAVRLARDLRGRPPRPTPLVVVHLDARDDEGTVSRVLGGVAMARDAGIRLAGRVVADPLMAAGRCLAGLARRLELPPPIAVWPDASIASLVEADVAVVTSGMVAYEAAACGVATIVVGAPRGVSSLAAGGAVVGLPAAADEERIAAALTALVGSVTQRKTLVAASRTLVDGLGAERIADRMIALLARTRATDVGERRVG
jgi:hypothetical protein